jgi:hypothetical protein
MGGREPAEVNLIFLSLPMRVRITWRVADDGTPDSYLANLDPDPEGGDSPPGNPTQESIQVTRLV